MRIRLRLRTIISLALVLLLALFGVTVGRAYLGEAVDRYAEHGPAGTLVDLNGVAQLRDAFNAGAGTPRLVLLLSPT